MPHGVYEVVANHLFITLGTSHDTSAFACDALVPGLDAAVLLLLSHGTATELLVLCDAGGRNAARSLRFLKRN